MPTLCPCARHVVLSQSYVNTALLLLLLDYMTTIFMARRRRMECHVDERFANSLCTRVHVRACTRSWRPVLEYFNTSIIAIDACRIFRVSAELIKEFLLK